MTPDLDSKGVAASPLTSGPWSPGPISGASAVMAGCSSSSSTADNSDTFLSGSIVLARNEPSSKNSRLQASQHLQMPGSLMGRKVNAQRPVSMSKSFLPT